MAPIRDRPPYLAGHKFYHPYFQWKQHPSFVVAVATISDAMLYIGHGDSGMVVLESGEAVREQSLFAKSFSRGERPQPRVPDAALDSAFVTFDARWSNYYHFLCCTIPRLQIAKDAQIGNVPLVAPKYEVSENEPKSISKETYLKTLSVFSGEREINFLEEGVYSVKRLLLPILLPEELCHDRANLERLIAPQTEFGLPNIVSSITDMAELAPFYDIFEGLKARMLDGREGRVRKRPIYLDRADSRLPAHIRMQILGNLARYGIERVVLETLSLEEQIMCMDRASTIIAAHGAGLTNLLFANPGTQIVELLQKMPDEVVYRPHFYQIASGKGLPYSAIDPSTVKDISQHLSEIIR